MLKTKAQIAFPMSQRFAEDSPRTRNVIAWSSLVFAVLRSVCTFFAALDGLRVGIGLSSLVMAAGTAAAIDRFHVDWLRIPMISLALLGSVLNLVVLWQVRRLRQRPAERWRQVSPRPGKRMQLVLSIVTLILLGLEERQHLIWLHHL